MLTEAGVSCGTMDGLHSFYLVCVPGFERLPGTGLRVVVHLSAGVFLGEVPGLFLCDGYVIADRLRSGGVELYGIPERLGAMWIFRTFSLPILAKWTFIKI